MHAHGALDAAASMAFNFFLSLIPLMVLVGFILGHLVRTNGVEAFMQPLLDALPGAAAGDRRRASCSVSPGRALGATAPLSVVTFFWLASSGVNHMMNIFQKVLHASPRRWWKQRAIAFGCVVGGVFLVSVTSWAVFEADAAIHREEARAPRLAITWSGSKTSARTTSEHGAPGLHESKTIHGEKKRTTLRPDPSDGGRTWRRWASPGRWAWRSSRSSTATPSSVRRVRSGRPGRVRSRLAPSGSSCVLGVRATT